jgi:hypothetical protein
MIRPIKCRHHRNKRNGKEFQISFVKNRGKSIYRDDPEKVCKNKKHYVGCREANFLNSKDMYFGEQCVVFLRYIAEKNIVFKNIGIYVT